MSSLRYHPVEPETLEIHPEDIYLRDHDTENIFGDPTGRVTVGMRELFMVHHRFELKQKITFFGSLAIILGFAIVALVLIRSGYNHVQANILQNRLRAKTGLQITPSMHVDGRSLIRLYEGKDSILQEKYVNEIDKYLEAYTKEQDSRKKFTSDCNSTDTPEDKWCNFTLSSIPGSELCTKENKYGYQSREPCFLIRFKDRVGWKPEFKTDYNQTEIPYKCTVMHAHGMFPKSPINFTYIPSFEDNESYGSFPLNKIPSRSLKNNGQDVIDDEDGDTIYDLPPLAFIKISLPDDYAQGIITCRLINTYPKSEILNMNSLVGIRELSFSLTYHTLESDLLYFTEE